MFSSRVAQTPWACPTDQVLQLESDVSKPLEWRPDAIFVDGNDNLWNQYMDNMMNIHRATMEYDFFPQYNSCLTYVSVNSWLIWLNIHWLRIKYDNMMNLVENSHMNVVESWVGMVDLCWSCGGVWNHQARREGEGRQGDELLHLRPLM